MLEDSDISYIAARYSLLEEEPLLNDGEGDDGKCSEERRGGGGNDGFGEEDEVIEEECSDPASGEQHPSGGTGRRQNTLQPSLPNTVNRGGIALLLSTAAAELPFGTGASSQNTLIGPNATQQTDRVSSTHTGIQGINDNTKTTWKPIQNFQSQSFHRQI